MVILFSAGNSGDEGYDCISCITVDLGLLSPLDYPRTLSLWALLLRNELRTECTSLFTSPLKEIRREELSSLILLLRASKDRRSP